MFPLKCTICIILAIAIVQIIQINCAMTEAQLKAGGKVLRKGCQPKTNTSDESIENMHKGQWDDLPSTKCYAFCILNSFKLVNKDGQPNQVDALSQLDMLPVARQEPTYESAIKCKDECSDCSDKCDRAYALLKCVYFDNPDNYFAP